MAEDDIAGTHLISRGARRAFARFRVVVTGGPDRGKTVVEEHGELSIGTDPKSGLVLTDPSVSRAHCVISLTAQGFTVRDLGSTNGTTIGGTRVDTGYLNQLASIGVGRTMLSFEALDASEGGADDDRFGRALGKSVAMKKIFELLPRLAASESTVLLEGETGTGKSLLAEAIHNGSRRAQGPFVVVDCGAIPPTLIESELFGHEKGAFTGAHALRLGAFEAGAGGTVFLDEIGELPIEMQPKLLRALEDRVVKRVGGTAPIKLDVRLVAATNRDLRQEIGKGAFRADLYYRINTVALKIPPLRERREDIPALVEHFYRQIVQSGAQGGAAPDAAVVQAFVRHDWPGNVRELRSAVERAALMGDLSDYADVLGDAPAHEVASTNAPAAAEDDLDLSFREAKEQAVARWERQFLKMLVERAGGNLSRAARAARMDRNHLRELLRRHGLAG